MEKKIIVLIGPSLRHSDKILQACADALGKVSVENKDIIDGLVINDDSNHVFDVVYLDTNVEELTSSIQMIIEAGRVVMLAFDASVSEGTKAEIRRLLGYPVSWAIASENRRFDKHAKAVEQIGSIAIAFYFLHVENIKVANPAIVPPSFF